ncbi:MAG: TonB-dependent receptor [Novosphingobium sp.]|nr:TonB-dependent receptor [Novosphingobium sp.]
MANLNSTVAVRALRGSALAAIAATTFASPAAFAQDTKPAASSGGLSEIVVTAQRREENLQEVPIAINAIGADSLEKLGVSDTTSLVQAVPSLNFTRTGPSGIFIIRGVSTPNGSAGEEGSTAVYVDDVYMADLSSTINKFNNIERIEVLNGPQGTLFGRNAVGGLIRIITKDPGDELEFKGQLGVANYDTFSGQAYLSAPLGENVGMNVAFTGQDQGKGFGYNPTLGKRVRTDDYWGLRGKLVAEPTDNLKITVTGDYYKTDNDIAVYVFSVTPDRPTSQDSNSDYPSGTNIKVWGVSGKAELDLGFGTLTSISSYRKVRNRSSFDVDGSAIDLFHLSYVNTSTSFQQELRLASNDTEPLSWQFGAFYLHGVAVNDQIQAGVALGTNYIDIDVKGVTDSISVFGEVTYDITPTTHLTGGVRWTQDKRKLPRSSSDIKNAAGVVLVPRSNAIDHVTYDEFTFRAALRQDLSDDVSVYATVNRGFKSGAFNLQSPYDPPVKPQTIMAYEAGLKGEFLDRRLRLNLAAFHYDIDDYQIRSSPGGISLLSNAAKVKIDGVDVNAEAALSDQFSVNLGVSYLDSKYDSFPSADTGDATGNRTAIAPKFTFNASGTYTIPFDNGSELRLTGNYTHKSKYYFEPNNLLDQPGYDLISASAEYRVNENFAVEAWMRNIGNEKYNIQEATAIIPYGLAGEPRTYGLNFKISY